MKTKITALWNILTSRYFVVFATRSKHSKWTTISATLDEEEHSKIADIIIESNKDNLKKKQDEV